MSNGRKGGFTLVEVLVAIVLVGIAVATLTGGLASLTQSFRRAVEREEIQRLAQQKLDELVGTGEWVSLSDGGFEGEQFEDYSWAIFTEPTAIDGLEYVRVTVTLERAGRTDSEYAEGLVYRPTTTIAGGAPQ